MHKLIVALMLVALLILSATAAHAVITWDDDPAVDIGGGYWAHLRSGTDAGGGVSVAAEDVDGGIDGDRVWAGGCTRFKGSGEAAVQVWITKGSDGPPLGTVVTRFGHAPGSLCAKVELEIPR
jgi:hypothetical protein